MAHTPLRLPFEPLIPVTETVTTMKNAPPPHQISITDCPVFTSTPFIKTRRRFVFGINDHCEHTELRPRRALQRIRPKNPTEALAKEGTQQAALTTRS